jgi:hypothetical protein
MKGVGDKFDDFMKKEGLYKEAKSLAIKKLLIFQLEEEMKKQNKNKIDMAKIMKTSRVAINNILDPNHNSRLFSLVKFALALGKNITLSLTDL